MAAAAPAVEGYALPTLIPSRLNISAVSTYRVNLPASSSASASSDSALGSRDNPSGRVSSVGAPLLAATIFVVFFFHGLGGDGSDP